MDHWHQASPGWEIIRVHLASWTVIRREPTSSDESEARRTRPGALHKSMSTRATGRPLSSPRSTPVPLPLVQFVDPPLCLLSRSGSAPVSLDLNLQPPSHHMPPVQTLGPPISPSDQTLGLPTSPSDQTLGLPTSPSDQTLGPPNSPSDQTLGPPISCGQDETCDEATDSLRICTVLPAAGLQRASSVRSLYMSLR